MFKEIRLPFDFQSSGLKSLPGFHDRANALMKIERRNHVNMIWHYQHEPNIPSTKFFVVPGTIQQTFGNSILAKEVRTSLTAIDCDEMSGALSHPRRNAVRQFLALRMFRSCLGHIVFSLLNCCPAHRGRFALPIWHAGRARRPRRAAPVFSHQRGQSCPKATPLT